VGRGNDSNLGKLQKVRGERSGWTRRGGRDGRIHAEWLKARKKIPIEEKKT